MDSMHIGTQAESDTTGPASSIHREPALSEKLSLRLKQKMAKAAVDFAKFYDDIIKLDLIHIMSFPLSAAALWL